MHHAEVESGEVEAAIALHTHAAEHADLPGHFADQHQISAAKQPLREVIEIAVREATGLVQAINFGTGVEVALGERAEPAPGERPLRREDIETVRVADEPVEPVEPSKEGKAIGSPDTGDGFRAEEGQPARGRFVRPRHYRVIQVNPT